MTLAIRSVSDHRSFEAACLGLVLSSAFMPCTDKELRPTLVTFACSSQVFRPFVANIWEKRDLELLHPKGSHGGTEAIPFGLLKSAGYELSQQVVGDSIVGTFYLPQAFHLEPPNTETGRCDFIMLPTREQLETNAAALDNKAIVMYLLRLGRSKVPATMLRYFGALACLWAGYVDRRVHAPMIQEPAFYALAFYDAMTAGFVNISTELDETNPNARYHSSHYGWRDAPFPPAQGLRCHGLEALGYAMPALVTAATEEQMQGLLAETIKSYSAATAAANDKIELPEGL